MTEPDTSPMTGEPMRSLASVTTTKPVLAHELSEELGGAHVEATGLAFVDGEPTTVTADVDQAVLEQAIAAHQPSVVIPHPFATA